MLKTAIKKRVKEREIIDNLLPYIAEIRINIGNNPDYAQNIEELNNVETYVEEYVANYEELLSAGNGKYNKDGVGFAKKMQSWTGFITSYCNSLMRLELSRSVALQDEINKSFNGTIAAIVWLRRCRMVYAN